MNTDTPRTEAERDKELLQSGKPAVSVAFARQLERELNAANERIAALEAEADLAGIDGMKARIKRLEEAGEQLWKKAHFVSCKDVWTTSNEDEIPVTDLPPDTIVYATDFGDGVSAGDLVALNKALDDWHSAKTSK